MPQLLSSPTIPSSSAIMLTENMKELTYFVPVTDKKNGNIQKQCAVTFCKLLYEKQP
jgi:hypothetical protein